MNKSIHRCILLSFLFMLRMDIGFSSPVTIEKRVTAESYPHPDNSFDTGLIESCKVPTSEQLPVCSKYITYPVPEALLSSSVASIREKAVYGAGKNARDREESTGDAGKVEDCGNTVQELECYQKFPPCASNNTEVAFTNETCLPKLNSSCTDYNLWKLHCGIQETVSLATCTSVNSSSHKYQYKYCSDLQGWSSVYLTDWMSIFVTTNAERDIKSFIDFVQDSTCVALYKELKCGEAGRCWHQGTRMEINSTREQCIAVLNCVSSALRTKLEEQLNCSLYPIEAEKLSTPATEITQPTMEPEETNSSSTTQLSTESPADTDQQSTDIPSVVFPHPSYPEYSSASSAVFTPVLLVFSLLIVGLLY